MTRETNEKDQIVVALVAIAILLFSIELTIGLNLQNINRSIVNCEAIR